MADDRTYIRLHDGFDENHKIVGTSDKEFRTYIEALCYCSRNLSDGFIPFGTSKKLATPRVWRALVESGLIEDHSEGYVVHDYLEHQRSAEQVKQYKEAKREAGRKGGRARAAAQAEPKHVLEQTPKQTPSKSNPEAEAETEEKKTTSSSARKRATQAPEDFEITAKMRQWARDNDVRVELERETQQFLDHHRAKGSTFKDWTLAWQTWMRNSLKFNNVRQMPGTESREGKVKMKQLDSGRWAEVHPEDVLFGVHTEWRVPGA